VGEPSDGPRGSIAPPLALVPELGFLREPEVSRIFVEREAEPGGHHPDDEHALTVHRHGSTHSCRIAAEALPPESVRHHRHPPTARLVLAGLKCTTQQGAYSQDVE
jgi:hypothetical protein